MGPEIYIYAGSGSFPTKPATLRRHVSTVAQEGQTASAGMHFTFYIVIPICPVSYDLSLN